MIHFYRRVYGISQSEQIFPSAREVACLASLIVEIRFLHIGDEMDFPLRLNSFRFSSRSRAGLPRRTTVERTSALLVKSACKSMKPYTTDTTGVVPVTP
jgi:hypothetical protein